MTRWCSDAVASNAVRARVRGPRGLTLIELLAAIAVIAVVMSIALPSLARVKAESVRLQCLINARSLATLVQSYATSNADTPPSWIERGVSYEMTPARWIEYTTQNFTTFEHDRWLDYAGFTPDSETLYCPANTARPEYYETVPEPDYWISSAFHARPAYLDPALPSNAWYGKLGAGVQRMHSVRFPARSRSSTSSSCGTAGTGVDAKGAKSAPSRSTGPTVRDPWRSRTATANSAPPRMPFAP